jgi:phytoene desaturase
MKQTAIVIGSGIGGISSAIRLANSGYKVTVFEQASKAGGKISEIRLGHYRFDTGPSLFTLPMLVDELFTLCGKDPREYFHYLPLDASCKYLWEDGTEITAWHDTRAFAAEVETKTGVAAQQVHGFLDKSRRLYELTSEVFLFNSFHNWRNFLKPAYKRSLLHLHELDAFVSMHHRNKKWFRHPKIVQLFDRYATYNGSSPYKTPATLNIISHLEHNIGAFFPVKGMYSIAASLQKLAEAVGVSFIFNSRVEEVILKNNKIVGIRVNDLVHAADVVVSNVDIVPFYQLLMPGEKIPRKQLTLERSTSALIFYWGIDRQFPNLNLHNILFSENYRQEFDHLFGSRTIGPDPTVYLFISSKQVDGDAPAACENWYVMINVPENIGQDWDSMVVEARKSIIRKIQRVLQTDIEPHIVAETMADPRSIERDTGSYRGSLYGLSSNGKFAAFNRHPNARRKYKNLFFTGGSVHPGGGIPLCLASAKIVDQEIRRGMTV